MLTQADRVLAQVDRVLVQGGRMLVWLRDGNLRLGQPPSGDLTPGARWPWSPGGQRRALIRLIVFVVVALAVGTAILSPSFLYLVYIGISLALGAIGGTTLAWMLHAWWTPETFARSAPDHKNVEPTHSFSLIVPARHEEAVLEVTLSGLVRSDHPAFEVLVVVGADDPGTRAAAERVADCYPDLVRVIVDSSWPKSKPKALNAALPHCTGTITGVFDAEDDVHPELLRRVDERFQRTAADVVQAGVQLMNFRSSWLTVRNVLEYYFWFRSRLHLHARQRFIPLGGNTVFVRTEILQAVSGWDSECLAEDCELGVRLSALGAQTVVFYEPELVTREECPPTLGAFIRQRTRWNQGYLQTLSKGYWRRLPLRQRALGVYILAMPFAMAIAWVLLPVAVVTALEVKTPVPITLISFLPALPMVSILVVELAGLGEFCRAYGERASARDYARLVLGLPLYQAVLAFAAARAVVRTAVGDRGWEKTAHLGLHLTTTADPAIARAAGSTPRLSRRVRHLKRAVAGYAGLEMPLPAPAPVLGLASSNGTVELNGHAPSPDQLPALAGDAMLLAHLELPREAGVDGKGRRARRLRPGSDSLDARRREPLWTRLDAVPLTDSAAVSMPSIGSRNYEEAVEALLAAARALGRKALIATLRVDVLLQVALLFVVGVVMATNLLHWPIAQFDEGTYVGNAWAVTHGRLAPYTYSYGHPPLAWLLIFVWTWASGIFGHASFSIDEGREFMVVVNLVSCSLLYVLARRLNFGRAAAVGAVLLFTLSPLAIFYHRGVLLDNPSIAWALAAFVLARTPQHRLSAFAASGACFALSVLCKETTIVLLPALIVAAAQNADRRTVRYCVTLFGSFFLIVALSYPLYATLKGELLPGRGHVSLVGYAIVQLFTRQSTGSVFNPHSQTHAIVKSWLQLDPWLLGAGIVLSPIALARRSTRAIALAVLIQAGMILRPGYLPNMFVIGLLPFLALIVAGSIEALVRWLQAIADRATAWLLAAYIGVPLLIVAVAVTVRWASTDRGAMTTRVDTAMRDANRWLVNHVSRRKRLIVTDDTWIYLIEHGFNSQPMRGGFYSRTVVSYWPLDYDPAVKRAFPYGWRDFDYVVLNQDMRVTMSSTPTASNAVSHSRVVASFGRGAQLIQIRAIIGARPGIP